MGQFDLLCFVLLLVAAIDIAARRVRLPYPILMVICGLGLGLVPGLPQIEIEPELILPLFLPPLLFPAAFQTPWFDFKRNLPAVTSLAVGLLLVTIFAVAWISHSQFASMSWATAFILGAIVAPPDAIAATAVFARIKVPRRIITILEGESLVNDTLALVVYRFAVAAVVTGFFSPLSAAVQIPLAALGGFAIGGCMGLIFDWVERRLDDAPIQITVALLTPFAAYLGAEKIGASGALAIVTAGLYVGWRVPQIIKARVRLEMTSFWKTLTFFLNGFIFVYIGLQLPIVVKGMSHDAVVQLVYHASGVSVVIIVIRIVWVFFSAYLSWFLKSQSGSRNARPNWRHLLIIGWAGMRGAGSLATALAIPIVGMHGMDFPERDAIIFISFFVIFVTLVVQGLSLPVLIRILGIKSDDFGRVDEVKARIVAVRAALHYLGDQRPSEASAKTSLQNLQTEYRERLAELEYLSLDGSSSPNASRPISYHHRFEREVLKIERRSVVELRNKFEINDTTLRLIQRDIDLAEALLIERER